MLRFWTDCPRFRQSRRRHPEVTPFPYSKRVGHNCCPIQGGGNNTLRCPPLSRAYVIESNWHLVAWTMPIKLNSVINPNSAPDAPNSAPDFKNLRPARRPVLADRELQTLLVQFHYQCVHFFGTWTSFNMSAAKHWTFTVNNYTPEVFAYVTTPRPSIKYLIVGKEVGASGTPHLQGYAILSVKKTRAQAKLAIVGPGNHAHLENAKGNAKHNINYVSKGDMSKDIWDELKKNKEDPTTHPTYGLNAEVTEVGVRPKTAASKGENIYEAMQSYIAENAGRLNEYDMSASNYEFMCKHEDRFNTILQQDINDSITCDVQLWPWQQAVKDYWIDRDVGNRRILFIVDEVGNAGKTILSRYCLVHRPGTQILRMGRVADMAHAINNHNDLFFINIPRTKMEMINYETLEDLKDGMVWSPKYKSMMKMFRTSPNLIVTMNSMPNMEALSQDRYVILILENGNWSCEQVPELNTDYVPPEPETVVEPIIATETVGATAGDSNEPDAPAAPVA